ncbi:MAG: HAMP domain-containing protein [Proteobacteria bacterium]|nr:HAMP domain-containing protein [Pseudomonadota bacterium]
MRPIRTALRTTAFRLALLYAGLFGASVLALLLFLYFASAGLIARQADETIEAEITGLAEHYRRRGLGGLVQVVIERAQRLPTSVYLLADPLRRPLAGNLDSWPEVGTGPEGWLEFSFEAATAEGRMTHRARARHLVLTGGFNLLVGRDIEELRLTVARITEALLWALALTAALALGGGLVMSRNALRRIEAINRTSREIMAGDLSRRVPLSGSGDELDELAANLNAMLAQIERLMTGLRQVTDNIAHDLRTPLSRMRARLEVALMQPAAAATYRQEIERTIAEAEALIATFNALLAIAEAEAGAEREAMERVDLAALVRDAADLYAPLAEEAGLAFSVRIAGEGELAVRGHRHLLSQALANLIDNAVKYTPRGGAVAVVAARGAAGIEVVVADTGPGIPEAERERVLGRFVRLEASRSTPGSGLGLSLAAAVAARHGARLRLEDNRPGLRAVLLFPPAPPAKALEGTPG